MNNIQHSSESNEWYTPPHIIDKVIRVLGPIDFDPASCEQANETVKAKEYYAYYSLEKDWLDGSIFLNPPGGKTGNKSNTVLFWRKLMKHRGINPRFSHAIFLAFSIEALQTTQSKETDRTINERSVQGYPELSLGDFLMCIPSKRIKFISQDGISNNPTHASVIAYVPGYLNYSSHFRKIFNDLGLVR